MSVNSEHIRAFRGDLIDWYRATARDLPWRSTTDPYRIWVSEVMLQQTRVDQATPYYERFLDAFPDMASLAEARLDDVLRIWEGLGYYSRARNLHKAARLIVESGGSEFPRSVDEAVKLPGVGSYTAAAVTSIAYGVPAAAVDGNVLRVLARVFAIEMDTGLGKVRRLIAAMAADLLDPSRPGDFNEAVMELGATVCLPKRPTCEDCPLQTVCSAYRLQLTDSIPVRSPKRPTPHDDVAVGVVRNADGQVLLVRRSSDGLLGGLWEFPGSRRRANESLEEACERGILETTGILSSPITFVTMLTHQFSHLKISVHVFDCAIESVGEPSGETRQQAWAHPSELREFAMHRTARRIADMIADEPVASGDVDYKTRPRTASYGLR